MCKLLYPKRRNKKKMNVKYMYIHITDIVDKKKQKFERDMIIYLYI